MAHTKGVPESLMLTGVMYKGEEVLTDVPDRSEDNYHFIITCHYEIGKGDEI